MPELDFETGQSGPALDHLCLLDTPDARVRQAAMAIMAPILAHETNQPLPVATNFIRASANLLRKRGEGHGDVFAMIEKAVASRPARTGRTSRSRSASRPTRAS